MKAAAIKHEVVSEAEWLKARKKLLIKEKKFTRMQEEINLERRNLPWVKMTKKYAFEGPNGKATLVDLFEGRSQLVIYHFMFGPNDKLGCPHCSLRADGFNGINVHLKHRDVAMICVSRALREAGGLQETDGLGFHMGVLRWHRFQFRLSRVFYARRNGEEKSLFQLRRARSWAL